MGRLQLPLYAPRKVPVQGHSPASGISPGYPSRGRPHPIQRESYPRHPQYAKLTLPEMYKSNVYRSNGYKAMMDLAVIMLFSPKYFFRYDVNISSFFRSGFQASSHTQAQEVLLNLV